MKEKIIDEVLNRRLIVIVRNVELDKLMLFAEALYEGGIRLMEITYSADGRVSDEDTAKSIEILNKKFEGRMYIGAGTVLTEEQVERTEAAGGRFIISPDVCGDVIKKTNELGLVSIPGAVTPSEIRAAHCAGADFIKLFPASNLGTEYVKAILAPLSNIKLLMVGGIDELNMKDYFKAGACGFGIGSNIVNKNMIANNDFGKITEIAKRYVKAAEGQDGI